MGTTTMSDRTTYPIRPDRPNRDGLPPGPVSIELALQRRAAQLFYPKSRKLKQYRVNELESALIDECPRGTYVRTFLAVDAPEADLFAWYDRELMAREWVPRSRNAARGMKVFTRRDTETYTIVLRREGDFGRPSNAPRGRLAYEVMYTIVGRGRAG